MVLRRHTDVAGAAADVAGAVATEDQRPRIAGCAQVRAVVLRPADQFAGVGLQRAFVVLHGAQRGVVGGPEAVAVGGVAPHAAVVADDQPRPGPGRRMLVDVDAVVAVGRRGGLADFHPSVGGQIEAPERDTAEEQHVLVGGLHGQRHVVPALRRDGIERLVERARAPGSGPVVSGRQADLGPGRIGVPRVGGGPQAEHAGGSRIADGDINPVRVRRRKDSLSMDKFFRMMTPNTGNVNEETIVNAMSSVFDKTGDGILFTHSAGGAPGWKTAIKNSNVKAVIAIEPGGFAFPEGEVPADNRGGKGIPLEEFKKLIKIPIVVYFGDYIPKEETKASSLNFWRNVLATARQWAKVVNAHGGDATIVYLPEIGIKGNTHFIMSDLNNVEITNLISKWLKEKGLNK